MLLLPAGSGRQQQPKQQAQAGASSLCLALGNMHSLMVALVLQLLLA